MRALLSALVLLATACEGSKDAQLSAQIVHDTVHDTVFVPTKAFARAKQVPRRAEAATETAIEPATETRSATAEPSVFARCLAAARLQARAHDETFGGYSTLQDSARDANMVMICKLQPGTYLPELR